MRVYMDEGSMSPMTGLSELTLETNNSSSLLRSEKSNNPGFSFSMALQQNNEFSFSQTAHHQTQPQDTSDLISSDISEHNITALHNHHNNTTILQNPQASNFYPNTSNLQNTSNDSAFQKSPDKNLHENFEDMKIVDVESLGPSLNELPAAKTSSENLQEYGISEHAVPQNQAVGENESDLSSDLDETDDKLLASVIQKAQPEHDLMFSPNKSKLEQSHLVERSQRRTYMQKLLSPQNNKYRIDQMVYRMENIMSGNHPNLDKSFLSKSSASRSLENISEKEEFSFFGQLKRIQSDPTLSRNTSTATNLRDTTSPENQISDQSPLSSLPHKNFNFFNQIVPETPPENVKIFGQTHSRDDEFSYATSVSNITFEDSSNNVNFATTSTNTNSNPFVPAGTPEIPTVNGISSNSDFQIQSVSPTSPPGPEESQVEYPIFNTHQASSEHELVNSTHLNYRPPSIATSNNFDTISNSIITTTNSQGRKETNFGVISLPGSKTTSDVENFQTSPKFFSFGQKLNNEMDEMEDDSKDEMNDRHQHEVVNFSTSHQNEGEEDEDENGEDENHHEMTGDDMEDENNQTVMFADGSSKIYSTGPEYKNFQSNQRNDKSFEYSDGVASSPNMHSSTMLTVIRKSTLDFSEENDDDNYKFRVVRDKGSRGRLRFGGV